MEKFKAVAYFTSGEIKENGFLLFSEGTDGEVEFVKAFNECLEEVSHVRT